MMANVGCGQTPTPGWLNFDNSVSLTLARHIALTKVLRSLKLLNEPQTQFIAFARAHKIRRADCRTLPVSDNAFSALYSSHMFEHLDREEASQFLREAYRVICPGGVLRLAVPDLKRRVERYVRVGDADAFIESLNICEPKPKSMRNRLRDALAGRRHHYWMYDAESLKAALESHGFIDPVELPPGKTTIADPGELESVLKFRDGRFCG